MAGKAIRESFILVLNLLLQAAAVADDWPQWRGPRRDGTWREEGIVETFPVEGINILWRAPVGWGYSSPVVAEGRVFVTDSELEQPRARERVVCFDASSGKKLWAYAYDVTYPAWAFTPDQSGGPCATPVVADGKVYVVGGNGDVLCLSTAMGELVWRKELGKDYEISTLHCRGSPLIDHDRLIVFAGGKPNACVIALERSSGRELWKALDEAVSNSSPVIVRAAGKNQLIVWTGESVSALDPVTGATYWREPMTTSNNDAIATPVSDNDRLLISGLMFRLDPDKLTASVIWPENRALSHRILSNTSTPMLAGDLVFSATTQGDLVCLDARTGKEIWRTDKITDRKGGASIHLTAHGDAVFLYTDRGELIRARLTRAGYEEISRTRVIEPVFSFGGRKLTWSPPAYAGARIFVRDEREIVCASLAAAGRCQESR